MARILIVDDDPVLLGAATGVLRRAGHEIFGADNGLEGLRRAAECDPDLVITDINMPQMDGWEFVRQLRATKEHAWTPVFFLTDLGSRADRIRGFNLGADDYLQKPVAFEELGLRVARALETRDRLRSSVGLPTEGGVSRRNTGIRGRLSQIGLATLLGMVELERRTGEISVQSQFGTRGLLLTRDGSVVQAKVYADDVAEATEGPEAVIAMLGWQDGDFAVRPLDVDADDSIRRPVSSLLLEAARRMDEAGG